MARYSPKEGTVMPTIIPVGFAPLIVDIDKRNSKKKRIFGRLGIRYD
tara:strand:- start:1343 stop:1483 length:141 start_codon:yes stop_codon:yes gene_type:complete